VPTEQPEWPPPGDTAAYDADDFDRGLTAELAEPLIAKEIG
jgi:hypothetical protein